MSAEVPMTSSKPYLIRGLYEWLLDNEVTPYILIDANHDAVMVPPGITTDDKVVLNLSPSAVQQFEMTNEYLSFSARFSGVAQDIYCPMESVLAIYARENGEGMMFNSDSDKGQSAGGPASASERVDKSPKRTPLKIVK